MRKFFALLSVGMALFLANSAVSSAQVPDGVIELSGGSISAGIGYSWGSGTLIFQGQRYPLKISGISLVSVGIKDYTAAGSVEGLKTPEVINGVFTSVAAGATLGGGGSVSAMKNQNGVVIHLTSTSTGLSLTLATQGLKISLTN